MISSQYSTLAVGMIGALLVSACGGSKGGNEKNGDAQKGNPNRVNWESVPSEFNPRIYTETLDLRGADTVKLDLFGFKDDVSVNYSNVPGSSAEVKIYTVYSGSFSFGGVSKRLENSTLLVSNYGEYQCSIDTHNGDIQKLKGGCYVRIEVTMPAGAEIEVYNMSTLLTRRFKAMSGVEFLKEFDQVYQDSERFAIIDAYLGSYAGLSNSPTLTAAQLGQVLHEFPFKEAKMKALSRLQATVGDRDALGKTIDNEFNYFDRDEARSSVGLPPATR